MMETEEHECGGSRMHDVTVVSLGGSIISPDAVDTGFITGFREVVTEFLSQAPQRKLIIVTGGGAPARVYQTACRAIVGEPEADHLDWIGIAATRLNGELIRAVFSGLCRDPLVTDPTADIAFAGQVLVAAGWKPGFSSDNDAVVLAERFKADRVINLSNIKKVYTADPKKDPDAQPLDHIGWAKFREMVGDTWTPGANLPFDPIAAKRASELKLQVIAAGGRDLENFRCILEGKPFEGTTIGPEWQQA
jgi:uridylate kinase